MKTDMIAKTKTTWRTVSVTDLFEKLSVGKRYDQRTVLPCGRVPVIDQGKSGIIGYHNDEPGITATVGNPIVTFANHTCQVTLQTQPFSVIQNVFPLKAKTGVDPWFLYYRIKDAMTFQEYKGHWPDFVTMQFSVPPYDEQKSIAEILSAFDDKIENNNRIIKTLEEMAQAVFKEWFVNFRFPGHEKAGSIDFQLGKIPKGWKVMSAKQLVKRLPQGKTYRPEELSQKGEVPVYDQSSGVILGYHSAEPALSATTDKPIVIFGDHTCRMKFIIHPFSLGPNVVPFVGRDCPTTFVYFLVSGNIIQREYKRHWSEFEQQEFVVPPIALAEEYTGLIKPMVQKIVEAENENQKLASMRDLLLPRLMSGQLLVNK